MLETAWKVHFPLIIHFSLVTWNRCCLYCGVLWFQTPLPGSSAGTVPSAASSSTPETAAIPAGKEIWVCFLSLARSKLRLCSANHRAGYFINLACECDWLSIVGRFWETVSQKRCYNVTPSLIGWAPEWHKIFFGLHTFLRQQIGLQVAYDKIVLTASILYNNHANFGLRGPLFIHKRYRVSLAEAKIGLHICIIIKENMASTSGVLFTHDKSMEHNCRLANFWKLFGVVLFAATWYICIAAQVFPCYVESVYSKKVFFFMFYIKH